jgi:predicted RNA-binding Zn ribbon-like protein
VYADDRQVRRVRFDQRTRAELGYVVRIHAIGREPLQLEQLPRRGRNLPAVEGREVGSTADLAVAFANLSDSELSEYSGFLDWSCRLGIITDQAATALRCAAREQRRAADEVVAQARDLRTAIRALVTSKTVASDALTVITMARRRCGTHEIVEQDGSVLATRCEPEADDLGLPLCGLWRSVIGLLGPNLHGRARQCADQSCRRMFIDVSRNHSRRWCDMSSCGNRAKVRRFRQRQRTARTRASR